VTESEWLRCNDPIPMLRFLLGTDYPMVQNVEGFPNCKSSDRKMRLFACACYDRIRHLLPNAIAHAAVEVAERFADGLATVDELQQATARLWGSLEALEGRWRASQGVEHTALLPTHAALTLALQVVKSEAPKAAYYAWSNAYLAFAAIVNPGAASSENDFSASRTVEERAQTEILRCIFGNLFCPETIIPKGLRWKDETVRKFAQRIYDERAFDHLPVLGDALEDAGCTDPVILAHYRLPGEHVRGCWVIDYLLGKE
jgi:hypothetical protein